MRISPVSAQISYSTYTPRAEKTSPAPGKKDVVTLSDEGRKLQTQNSTNTSSSHNILDDFKNKFMDGAGKDGVITLDEIRAHSEKYTNKANDILDKTLAQHGISSDHNITIRTDAEGVVRVDSDLSTQDNDRLETALNEHPDFQQTFTKASSSRALLDAAEKYTEFAEAYAQDPKAAVAQYGIGNSTSGDYVLLYIQGQASLFLENQSHV